MYESFLPCLETPCILIDLHKVRDNINKMQKICDDTGVALRPHVKTHKIAELARMQLDAGAKGITCAKVSEAEIMADGGCTDIFIAYPLVGDFRVARAIALAKRVERLILAVDSLEGATALSLAAQSAKLVLEVRLEVETGACRTGLRGDGLVETALEIQALPGLRLTGVYTFKSLNLDNAPTADNAAAGNQEAKQLSEITQTLRDAGVSISEVSGGSSPTGEWVAKSGQVTEIRPGTYIFKDCILWKEGVAELDEIAAYVVATVVSTPELGYAVIDGGTKVFPTDIVLNRAPYFYEGYAKVVGNDDLMLTRVNEEHGMLYSKRGNTGLTVGQKLLLYPGHVCTTINLRNDVYVVDKNSLRRIKVDARGMSV